MKRLISKKQLERAYQQEPIQNFSSDLPIEPEEEVNNISDELSAVIGETIKLISKGETK